MQPGGWSSGKGQQHKKKSWSRGQRWSMDPSLGGVHLGQSKGAGPICALAEICLSQRDTGLLQGLPNQCHTLTSNMVMRIIEQKKSMSPHFYIGETYIQFCIQFYKNVYISALYIAVASGFRPPKINKSDHLKYRSLFMVAFTVFWRSKPSSHVKKFASVCL